MQVKNRFLMAIVAVLGAWSGAAVAQPPCCEIGTGAFDQQNGQQSQLPALPGTTFDYRVADDFYLSPDRIYRINSIEATMITDSTNPKAVLELYQDCNGFPADPPFLVVANATAITPTGGIYDGKPVYRVRFDFTDLWLRGGKSYWVSFIGKGVTNTEVWFWGTAGFGFFVSGTPGAFKSVSAGIPAWKHLTGSTAGCPGCIGCTDFAFCVNASACKILHDNGTYSNTGTLSLDGPAGFVVQRVADDFVIPPCTGATLCYIEAYVATNCPSVGLSIYDNLCRLPASTTPRATLTPNRIVNTGQTTTINGALLPILCLQFWNIGLTVPPGKNYWVSAFGIGDGTVTQVAYFLHNQNCASVCLQKWNEGALYGAANAQPAWVKASTVLGTPRDFAFLVAIVDPSPPFGGPGDPAPSCAADFNNNGTLNVEDIFAFLTEWFAGCI